MTVFVEKVNILLRLGDISAHCFAVLCPYTQEHAELGEGVEQHVEKRFRFSYNDTWPAAFLVDPIHFIKSPGGWVLPFSLLASCEVDLGEGKLMLDAKEAMVRLAGGETVRNAVMAEFGRLRMGSVPPSLADVCEALSERTTLENGRVLVCDADSRRAFWLIHMHPSFPYMAAAAGRLLSAHVTSCSTERNWSLFGNIFSKTRNRLVLERAKKLAYIRSNNSSGTTGADEEVALSPADMQLEDDQRGGGMKRGMGDSGLDVDQQESIIG